MAKEHLPAVKGDLNGKMDFAQTAPPYMLHSDKWHDYAESEVFGSADIKDMASDL